MKEGYVSDKYYQVTEYTLGIRNRVVGMNLYLKEALELVKALHQLSIAYECYNHTFIIDEQKGYNEVEG